LRTLFFFRVELESLVASLVAFSASATCFFTMFLPSAFLSRFLSDFLLLDIATSPSSDSEIYFKTFAGFITSVFAGFIVVFAGFLIVSSVLVFLGSSFFFISFLAYSRSYFLSSSSCESFFFYSNFFLVSFRSTDFESLDSLTFYFLISFFGAFLTTVSIFLPFFSDFLGGVSDSELGVFYRFFLMGVLS
jgi:hypothetical protein